MVRWYQQRKPVDLIQACREEADAARPQAPETPDFMNALITEANTAIGAGGWCAPSELLYLPEISVKRGGLKF